MHFPLTRSQRQSERSDLSLRSRLSSAARFINGLSHAFSVFHVLGFRKKYTHLPSWRSDIKPAFFSVRRWAETRGWDIPRIPSNSQTHRSFSRRRERILSRLGSLASFMSEKTSGIAFKIGQARGRPPARRSLLGADAAGRTSSDHLDRPCHHTDGCHHQRPPHGFFHAVTPLWDIDRHINDRLYVSPAKVNRQDLFCSLKTCCFLA